MYGCDRIDKAVDLTGKRFGRLTVISLCDERRNRQRQWVCRCDCGNEVIVRGAEITRGHTTSCGCYARELLSKRNFKHGGAKRHSQERLYEIWCDIKKRCYNPNMWAYDYYGGRGISMCPDWLNDYTLFREWALANGYEQSLTIDRIDNNGNYEPSNCRWVDRCTQTRNREITRFIEIDGVKKTIMQWSEESGIKYMTIYNRIYKGWDAKDAVFKEVKHPRK